MPFLTAAGLTRAIDLAVFDKDGTLIDFDMLWAGKLRRAMAAVATGTGLSAGVMDAVQRVLGLDTAGAVVPESPLAVGTLGELAQACATELATRGCSGPRADAAMGAFERIIAAPPERGDLRPCADLTALFGRLRQAGIAVAVLTSDSRAPTLAALDLLGVAHLVDAVCCGDDPLPPKPAPDGFLRLCAACGVAPSRAAMIGDSLTDMATGRAAGAGFRIGMLTGTAPAAQLAPQADLLLESLDGLLATPVSGSAAG